MAIALSHQNFNCNRNFSRYSQHFDLELQIANFRYRYKNKIDLF